MPLYPWLLPFFIAQRKCQGSRAKYGTTGGHLGTGRMGQDEKPILTRRYGRDILGRKGIGKHGVIVWYHLKMPERHPSFRGMYHIGYIHSAYKLCSSSYSWTCDQEQVNTVNPVFTRAFFYVGTQTHFLLTKAWYDRCIRCRLDPSPVNASRWPEWLVKLFHVIIQQLLQSAWNSLFPNGIQLGFGLYAGHESLPINYGRWLPFERELGTV